MPRYLTAVRICLLVLVELHISGEIPTNVKLDVLAFIASQVILPSDLDDASVEDRLYLSSSDITALSNTLSQWQSGIPGRSIYDRLLRPLWALTGPDALFDLFNRLKGLVTPVVSDAHGVSIPKISRSSPLGQFIRRCCYEFERLQFADVQKLWAAFDTYRVPSYNTWFERDQDATRMGSPFSGDRTRETELFERPYPEYVSTQDVDTILTLSIHQLQKLGGRVPQDVKSKLRAWFEYQNESNAESLQHFMAFFEHWRAAQMSMALESLHQYFDYSLGANRGLSAENLKVYFQYAQLHQSVLYAEFECWEESANAMSECIATARENQDTACLNFALSWLLHLRQIHPNNRTASFEGLIRLLGGSTEHDEIAFLKAKARETKHWSLMSCTLLEEAKLEMYRGGNITKAFEHILEASSLNVQHDQRALMVSATLFESACFERLGQSRLGYRVCESAALLPSSHSPLSDSVRSVCRVSHILAQMGHYTSAENILKGPHHPSIKGVVKLEERVAAFNALADLKRLIHRDKGSLANELLADVFSICSAAGPEVEFETYLLDIQHLMEMEEYEEAMSSLNIRLKELSESRVADIAQRLHLLVMKSKIFLLTGQSAKGFSLALRVASTARRHQLLSVLMTALGVLSKILVDLSEFDAARDLLEAALPHALGMPDLQLRAELFAWLADAHIGIAQRRDQPRIESINHLNLAVNYVDRSCAAYAKLEDRFGTLQCLMKKMEIARRSNDDATAAQASAMYQQILATGEPADVFQKVEEEAGALCI